MERINEYLTERSATLTSATPVTGPEAVLADIAAEAVASADARKLLRTLGYAVRNEQHTIRIRLRDGVDGENPAHRMAQRLGGLGYLRSVRIDQSTRSLQAHLSTRLTEAMGERLQRLTQDGRWLECGAAGHLARAAEAARVDLDLALNAQVRFDDGVRREIDVLAVGDDAVVAIEVKSGGGFVGEGGRFADLVERLGLAVPQGILLATDIDGQAAQDLAGFHPITVSDGRDVEALTTAALAAPRPAADRTASRSRVEADEAAEPVAVRPTGAKAGDAAEAAQQPTTEEAGDAAAAQQPAPTKAEPTAAQQPTAEVEAAVVEILAGSPAPATVSALSRLVRDRLATSRRAVQPAMFDLLSSGILVGIDGAPVTHFNDVVVRVSGEPAPPALSMPPIRRTSPPWTARGGAAPVWPHAASPAPGPRPGAEAAAAD